MPAAPGRCGGGRFYTEEAPLEQVRNRRGSEGVHFVRLSTKGRYAVMAMADYALMHVIHPLKRQILQTESKTLLEQALNRYA